MVEESKDGWLPPKSSLGTYTNDFSAIGIIYQEHWTGFLKYLIIREESSPQG